MYRLFSRNARPYKLTPIELSLSPKEHFEYILDKLNNNSTITDDEKLILLQMSFNVSIGINPCRDGPLKVDVIGQPPQFWKFNITTKTTVKTRRRFIWSFITCCTPNVSIVSWEKYKIFIENVMFIVVSSITRVNV